MPLANKDNLEPFRDAFHHGYEIEELARIQGVKPVEDFESLLGGWPDAIDDGFEEAVARWRGYELESKGEA